MHRFSFGKARHARREARGVWQWLHVRPTRGEGACTAQSVSEAPPKGSPDIPRFCICRRAACLFSPAAARSGVCRHLSRREVEMYDVTRLDTITMHRPELEEWCEWLNVLDGAFAVPAAGRARVALQNAQLRNLRHRVYSS